MLGTLRCRLGLHAWRPQRNEQGQGYLRCARCGKDDDRGARISRIIGA
ncbi:hypothetical protein [Geodermatophilus dictyosporus]|nr:hypothetical protein [Geodermatophilus dictyosporus]